MSVQPAFDPLPGAYSMTAMAAHYDELVEQLGEERELGVANHVYDGLRQAELAELEEHEEVAYQLALALPGVLSYRLYLIWGSHLHQEDEARTVRGFWGRMLRRREIAHLENSFAKESASQRC